MIAVKLMGGLGNQMFQYASGRSLAKKLNDSLILDLSYLEDRSPKEDFTYRDYALDCFNIPGRVLDKKKIVSFYSWSSFLSKIKLSTLNRVLFSNKLPLHKEFCYFDTGFTPSFFSLSKNTLLVGYWQSAKYFHDIEHLLKKEFEFRVLPDSKNQTILNLINKTESVGVHIRRGDYISNAHINAIHGGCDMHYYKEAIALIAQRTSSSHLFFFSDDMPWVKENFKSFDRAFKMHFVDINKERSYEDLRLMSNCKHNIIANSSFSWWGAWLNSNPSKQVIAPRKWFADPSITTNDLIPETWTRI